MVIQKYIAFKCLTKIELHYCIELHYISELPCMITHFTEIIVKFRKIHEKSINYRAFLSLFVEKCIEMTENVALS